MEPPEKKKVMLFQCMESEPLARRVAAASADCIHLQTINWRSFDDGFPNLFINDAKDIRGRNVAFLASFASPAVLLSQLSAIYALPRHFVASFTLVLPFLPTGSSEEGGDAAAFTMARLLSILPISRGGPTNIIIYDTRALQERFYFGDQVLPHFETGIPLLQHRLRDLPDNLAVAFPDDGAWKRFHKWLRNFPTVVCDKFRDGRGETIVRLKDGNPAGLHVVIVDDVVQSGGTLVECMKVLFAHGAAKVSAYVTHGVFPKKSWERFLHREGEGEGEGVRCSLTYFWITDSCPLTAEAVEGKAPF